MTQPGEAAFQTLHYWASRAVGRTVDGTLDLRLLRRLGVDEEQLQAWQPSSALETIFSLLKPDLSGFVQQAALQVTGKDAPIFPLLQADTNGYADRTAALGVALDGLVPGDEVTNQTRLLDALEREAWCLSSPLPHISLYDFARVQAALAAAKTCGGDLLLVGGDVSGVQDFIYDVQAGGAAKQQQS